MEELPLDICEEILVRLKAKDLILYKSVCKSWCSLISSRRFVDSHLDYNLKRQADNNETGHTRIVLTGLSRYDTCRIAGSSNGLVCVRFSSQLLVVNPSTHQLIKLKNLPQISSLRFSCMGFGYDSSIDDYKVVIGFKDPCKHKFSFLVLTLRSNVWRSVVGELDYVHMDMDGVLCNGAIHWLAIDRNNNRMIIVSFDLSKDVFKEIPATSSPLRGHRRLGTMKDRLCIFLGKSRTTPFNQRELWLMKNYNVQEADSTWEQMLLPPSCDDRKTKMNYIPRKSFSRRLHIWMLEEDSSVPVFVQSVRSPHGKAHIWLSTTSECNYNYNGHVFVDSLVSPRGMGNDNGNCNEGRVMMAMGVDSKGEKCRRERQIYN